MNLEPLLIFVLLKTFLKSSIFLPYSQQVMRTSGGGIVEQEGMIVDRGGGGGAEGGGGEEDGASYPQDRTLGFKWKKEDGDEDEESGPPVKMATNHRCDVCGEQASGHYFGALVCLPCKVRQISMTNLFQPLWPNSHTKNIRISH